MEYFFLARMGDFFTEGLCFDASTEGNGGGRVASPIVYEGRRRLSYAAGERGKTKDRGSSRWEPRPHNRTRWAEHVGFLGYT